MASMNFNGNFVLALYCRNDEGVKVKVVSDIPNPYSNQKNFDMRFMFTLNKIYAWKLTEYQRVVMLDVDNLFLRRPDELFQCGQFCAAFINPCIFHTGLFVLEVKLHYKFYCARVFIEYIWSRIVVLIGRVASCYFCLSIRLSVLNSYR
jgi:alpha-N-acetylglucosamine transferase